MKLTKSSDACQKMLVSFHKNDIHTYPTVRNILQTAAKYPSGIRTLSHLSSILKTLCELDEIYLTEILDTIYVFEPNSRTVVSYHSDDKWYTPVFNFSPRLVTDLFIDAYRYEINPFKQLEILQQLQHLDYYRFSELLSRFLVDNSKLSHPKITTDYHCSTGQSYSMDKILFAFGKEDFFLHLNKPLEDWESNISANIDMAIEKLDFNILRNFFSA